jgi:hypothetical protein
VGRREGDRVGFWLGDLDGCELISVLRDESMSEEVKEKMHARAKRLPHLQCWRTGWGCSRRSAGGFVRRKARRLMRMSVRRKMSPMTTVKTS